MSKTNNINLIFCFNLKITQDILYLPFERTGKKQKRIQD